MALSAYIMQGLEPDFRPSSLPSNPDDSAILLRRGVNITLHPATMSKNTANDIGSCIPEILLRLNSISVIFDLGLYNCNANPNHSLD